MFGINLRGTYLRKLLTFLISIVLVSGLVSCSDRLPELPKLRPQKSVTGAVTPKISEVSPPELIQQLHQALDIYQPQVTIQNPQPNQIFQDNTINVQLQVQDLPVFKSDQGLGPYLEVILDNKPYTKIYDINQSLTISDLEPGTHTLRIFACRPWNESFKNEGAYAQTTFHIFTKTSNNNPAPNLPLLTYNSPVGSYGAEPIMLDFYLTNAPLHLIAQQDPEDEIIDWRIRVTVNGTSFVTDQWQPIYLQGFHPGKNWVKLEYIDELGNPLNNIYNNTARLVTYQPDQEDILSQIIKGEISLQQAYSIVDPNYVYEKPQPEITPEVEETPAVTEPTPETETTSSSESIQVEPQPEEVPVSEPTVIDEVEAAEATPETPTNTESEETPVSEPTVIEEVEAAEPTPENLTNTESEATPVSEPTVIDEVEEVEPTPETPTNIESEETPVSEPTVIEAETSETDSTPSTKSQKTTKEKMGEFMNLVRRRFKGKETVTSTQEQQLNQTTETPTAEETVNIPRESETKESLEPNQSPTLPEIVEETPVPIPPEELAPEETSSLTPNGSEIMESPETSTLPEVEKVENDQPETTPELETVDVEKTESTEESFDSETAEF
ncbi:MAG: hypothetical protein QNJ68_01975 [Microcoleaceae cyanobacterium MO_207.B10]|nr:hypothetical protein [Microcoleaceae cyanobacterium MO_207.B10]